MRLLASISHHGFGHLAQAAPVLNALLDLRPELRRLVRSALPAERLALRIQGPFELSPGAMDCGVPMLDALRVDAPAALAAYAAFHRDWDRRVEAEAEWLRRQRVDLVFSNVAYLPLAAARLAGLPAVALCSLNWADIFASYFPPGCEAVREAAAPVALWLDQMRAAYASATVFLRPEPAMAMADLANGRAIPPVVSLGRPCPEALRVRLSVEANQRLVLVGMGGIDYRPCLDAWPASGDVIWLLPDTWQADRADFRRFSDTGMAFIDILASSDALVTKPGYGSFTEAAAHGLPVLYLPRPDWPESPVLEDWLQRNTRATRIEENTLQTGAAAACLHRLWGLPAPARPATDGALIAARCLASLLD